MSRYATITTKGKRSRWRYRKRSLVRKPRAEKAARAAEIAERVLGAKLKRGYGYAIHTQGLGYIEITASEIIALVDAVNESIKEIRV